MRPCVLRWWFNRWAGLTALTLLFAAPPVSAQFTTTIEGRISDPSDASIPNADVTVENLATGIKRAVKTSEDGYYRVTSLPPGSFTIRVSATGFETAVLENVALEADQTKTTNIALKLGSSATQISVEAGVPLVETGEARISNLITTRDVQELPLVGRNVMTLVVLTAGVTGLPSGGGQAYAQATGDVFAAEYGVNLNASGQRAESNSFLVDSASVNGSPRGGVTNYSPSADSVQEARVIVNNYSAEYGRNSSAMVNVLTKSGTNEWHGTVGWYHTNNRFSAHTDFQPNGVPVFRRNEFNGTLGFPIIKNKLFGFLSTDILRSGLGLGSSASAVTPQLASYVAQNFPNNISAKLIRDFPNQLTKTSDGLTAGGIAGTNCAALPGGPGASIPTPIGSLPCNFPMTFNGTFAQTAPRDGSQWNARVDYNFHEGNDRLFFSIGRTDVSQTAFGGANVYPAFTIPSSEYTGHFNLNYTHIFSPTFLNEASFSGTRAWGTDPVAHGEVPLVNVTGIAPYGLGFSDATFIQNNLEWRDVISYNRGAHAFKFGGILQCTSSCPGAGALFSSTYTRPTFTFNNLYDFVNDNAFQEDNIGFDPKTGSSFGPDFRPVFINFGFFGQDDWKVNPNLTVSLGLRWEVFLNPFEQDNLFVGATFPTGNNYTERLANLTPVQRKPLQHTDLNNFAPRLGIAWDPTGQGKMSVRAGVGVFYDRPAGQFFRDAGTSLPIIGVASVRRDTPPAVPVYGLSSTTAKPWKFPPIPGLQIGLDPHNGLIGAPSAITVWDPNLRAQYSYNWFFGIQRSFGNSIAVEANYVGSTGRKAYMGYDVNRYAGDLLDGRLNRINPSFAAITYGQALGNSMYTGANASIRKRYSFGLNLQAAYTFGRAIDYSSSFGLGLNVVDAGNLRSMRGLSDFDIRHKLSMSYVYDFPSPKSGVIRYVAGGWQLSGITILQSGSPFNVFCTQSFSPIRNASGAIVGNSGCDFNADGLAWDFVNAPAFTKRSGWSRQQWLSGAFQTSAFSRPGLGQEGSLGRNVFIGPAYLNTDVTLQKRFQIGERRELDFRSEFYNVFNETNLTNIQGDISSSLFGRARAAYAARNLQLGLKFLF